MYPSKTKYETIYQNQEIYHLLNDPIDLNPNSEKVTKNSDKIIKIIKQVSKSDYKTKITGFMRELNSNSKKESATIIRFIRPSKSTVKITPDSFKDKPVIRQNLTSEQQELFSEYDQKLKLLENSLQNTLTPSEHSQKIKQFREDNSFSFDIPQYYKLIIKNGNLCSEWIREGEDRYCHAPGEPIEFDSVSGLEYCVRVMYVHKSYRTCQALYEKFLRNENLKMWSEIKLKINRLKFKIDDTKKWEASKFKNYSSAEKRIPWKMQLHFRSDKKTKIIPVFIICPKTNMTFETHSYLKKQQKNDTKNKIDSRPLITVKDNDFPKQKLLKCHDLAIFNHKIFRNKLRPEKLPTATDNFYYQEQFISDIDSDEEYAIRRNKRACIKKLNESKENDEERTLVEEDMREYYDYCQHQLDWHDLDDNGF